jgi:hypothetical protein
METLLLFVAENRHTSQDYFLPLAYLHPSNGRLLQSKGSRENWYLEFYQCLHPSMAQSLRDELLEGKGQEGTNNSKTVKMRHIIIVDDLKAVRDVEK